MNHRDISIKFAYKSLGELIHEYFELEGEYIGLMNSETITLFGENLRKDISYKRTGQNINNVELQTSRLMMKNLKKIGKYISDILRNDNQQLENSITMDYD